MKPRQVSKPVLNTASALAFATGDVKTENTPNDIKPAKKMAKNALKSVSKDRIFFAPEGDKRLTINISSELHKKLKLAAVEGNSTAGEIIEQLIKQYVK